MIDRIYLIGAFMLWDLEGNYFIDIINGNQIMKYIFPLEEPP